MAKKFHGASKYHINATKGMGSSFSEGLGGGESDMISSDNGIFPEGHVIKDYPASHYGSRIEPYDDREGVDEQIGSDIAKLNRRSTKGSF